MVSEQACTIDHEMDQSLWQTPESIDFKKFIIRVNTNSIAMWVILLNNAGWDFQDSDFAGDLEDSKSTSGGTLCLEVIHLFQ